MILCMHAPGRALSIYPLHCVGIFLRWLCALSSIPWQMVAETNMAFVQIEEAERAAAGERAEHKEKLEQLNAKLKKYSEDLEVCFWNPSAHHTVAGACLRFTCTVPFMWIWRP